MSQWSLRDKSAQIWVCKPGLTYTHARNADFSAAEALQVFDTGETKYLQRMSATICVAIVLFQNYIYCEFGNSFSLQSLFSRFSCLRQFISIPFFFFNKSSSKRNITTKSHFSPWHRATFYTTLRVCVQHFNVNCSHKMMYVARRSIFTATTLRHKSAK